MVESFLLVIFAIAAVPVVVLFTQVMASLLPARSDAESTVKPRVSIAVLIPAHNEEDVLAETIHCIQAQLSISDRIVVVADNCSDATAQVAKDLEVDVIERFCPDELGKGFALAYGIEHIRQKETKPDVLVILDADCTINEGGIASIAAACQSRGRPVQALYLMRNRQGAGTSQKIAEFAWILKNQIRPQGFANLGLPCQLTGSGMAIPWKRIDSADFASSTIAEDLELGILYALKGIPPCFYPQSVVESYFPDNTEGRQSQRKRWEHGYLSVMGNYLPGLVIKGILKRDFNCLAVAFDLTIAPISLLVIIMLVTTCLALTHSALFGTSYLLLFWSTILAMFTASIVVAWQSRCSRVLDLHDILSVPGYVLKKFPLYYSYLKRRQVKWVKTARDLEKETDNR